MAISPAQQPDDNSAAPGSKVSGTDMSRAWSGTPSHDGDPTNMQGQYPGPGTPWANSLFGGPLPAGTGAPGSAPVPLNNGATDPTNEPGQTQDTFTGIPDGQIGGTGATGAPGASTTPNTEGGGTRISFTAPGSPYSGTYQSEDVSDDLSGPRDSTQANDQGYASGGPQLPGLKGNEPQAGDGRFQPKGGRVMRGGRDVRP